jgi:hypothetical protein
MQPIYKCRATCVIVSPSNLGVSPVAENEKTSARVAQIASKALQNPKSVTPDEIQTLAASLLTQSPDQQQRQQGQQHLQSQENQQKK